VTKTSKVEKTPNGGRGRKRPNWTEKFMKQLVGKTDGQTERNERMVNQKVIVRGQTVVVIGSDDKLR
jgi:rRNA processing protein Krr1/Pno1